MIAFVKCSILYWNLNSFLFCFAGTIFKHGKQKSILYALSYVDLLPSIKWHLQSEPDINGNSWKLDLSWYNVAARCSREQVVCARAFFKGRHLHWHLQTRRSGATRSHTDHPKSNIVAVLPITVHYKYEWMLLIHTFLTMASAHGQVGADGKVQVQGDAGVKGQGSFDMWRDYLSLNPLLKKKPGPDHPNPTGAPGSQIRTWQREDYSTFTETSSTENNSAEMSSVSSLSDTCSSSSGAGRKYCGFCRKNGESAQIYRSHKLKSGDGRVTCPILWSYTCPVCAATGDNAHTLRYCPQARQQKDERNAWPH